MKSRRAVLHETTLALLAVVDGFWEARWRELSGGDDLATAEWLEEVEAAARKQRVLLAVDRRARAKAAGRKSRILLDT